MLFFHFSPCSQPRSNPINRANYLHCANQNQPSLYETCHSLVDNPDRTYFFAAPLRTREKTRFGYFTFDRRLLRLHDVPITSWNTNSFKQYVFDYRQRCCYVRHALGYDAISTVARQYTIPASHNCCTLHCHAFP